MTTTPESPLRSITHEILAAEVILRDLIIGILGLKLSLSIVTHYYPDATVIKYIGTGGNIEHTTKENVDKLFSLLTLLVFFTPLIISVMFKFPKKRTPRAL